MNNEIIYPQERNLDGMYYRVERNGEKVNRCFTDLTVKEQERVLGEYDADALRNACYHLAACLRRLGDHLNLALDDE